MMNIKSLSLNKVKVVAKDHKWSKDWEVYRYEKLIKKIDDRPNKTDDLIFQRKLYSDILQERVRQVNKPVDGWELPNLKKVLNSIDKNEEVMNKNVQLDELQNVIDKVEKDKHLGSRDLRWELQK